jgi:hypothetical protein
MSWEREFSAGFSVPESILALARLGYLQDESWHNDVCPSFGGELMDGTHLKLWVGHPDPEHPSREEGCRTRFAVLVCPKGYEPGDTGEKGCEEVWQGEDELEAGRRVIFALQAHGGPRRQLRLAGRKTR